MSSKKKIFIRLAVKDDFDAIQALMKRSIQVLGQGHYSEKQIESFRQYVCIPDLQLIEDKTYFVAMNEDGTIVGCGGWSFRKTPYGGSETVKDSGILDPKTDCARVRAMFIDPAESGKGIGSLILSASEKGAKEYGFSRGVLGATRSGLEFYKLKGWKCLEDENAILPDGVVIEVTKMEKNL